MSYRPEIKSDANGTTQDLPIDAETVQGKTPVFTTTSQTISGVKIYKDTQKFEADINIDGTTTFGPTLFKSYLNSDGTINSKVICKKGGRGCVESGFHFRYPVQEIT